MNHLDLETIWREEIQPIVFARSHRVDNPTTIFLGGQPGAGKTLSQSLLTTRSSNPITPIVGDDLRAFHPDYENLILTDPLAMPDATSEASGRWIAMCVEHANQHGISTIIEGTWRRSAIVLDEATTAKHYGRTTIAVIVAVPPALSLAGIAERFYRDATAGKPARWTPLAAHNNTVRALPETVTQIVSSPLIDKITVTNRAGNTLYTGTDPHQAIRTFRQNFTRPLTPGEKRDLHETIPFLTRAATHLTPGNNEARQLITTLRATIENTPPQTPTHRYTQPFTT